MVLSSKQVSGDGIDWDQTLLQRGGSLELHKPPPPQPPPPRRQQTPPSSQSQLEPLKCPRCDSTNTKFCYFNNYNKSQPRHFCKSCKRHWTKGGTLRNVPVGGGRKNKRPKTASATAAAAAASSATTGTTGRNIIKMGIQPPPPQPRKSGDHHEKSSSGFSSILYRALIRPPPPQQQQNSTTGGGGTAMMSSMASIPALSPNHFSFLDPSCSITSALQASNAYNHYEEAKAEASTMAGTGTTGGSMMMSSQQPWQMAMDSTANYWSWDDIDTLVSSDLNIPWDDSEIKP